MSNFNWAEFYYYDETSPSCLRFKISRGNRKKDDVVGYKNDNSRYYRLSGKNGETLVHRIIWKIFNLEIPDGFVIDHIDGDSFNNKISNLRCVTLAENKRNQSKVKSNKSGVTGVRYEGGKNPRWRAEWVLICGKSKTKSFSVKKYGDELAYELACAYREDQIRYQNSIGGGFSERHGK